MKRLFTILLISAMAYSYWSTRRGKEIPYVSMPATGNSSDPCEGMKRCIVAYLTPWCPHCRSSVRLINSLQEICYDSEDVGVQIIVGQDEPDAMWEFADKFPDNIYIDEDSIFADTSGVSGYPHWWLLDEERKIITHRAGGLSGGSLKRLTEHMLTKVLGLTADCKP